ncbi:Hsp20/alpha crystallin family protein [Thalassotalea sp. M1531]|uniref:Hsp20/alpha crystallin family protein n=1 Tax=Thalassotalea algicola TaxID=2716224 RepID=A0A7Y0L9H1_9GAMM|nr:Hsp20/alpha crystallin family protein [Thalassotalea algicola]NMP30104.1 Hsp20/alpha crystallin family protein [Thalassotalea algicola]
MSLLPREQWFDMDHFFDHFFPDKRKDEAGQAFFSPKVDITDKGDNYEIIAELPGVNKEDVSVQLHDGILTIEAKTCEESKSEKDKVIRRERRTGYFSRSFTLGTNVSANDIHAKFEKGLLTLTAPKLVEQETEKRKISIN